MFVELSCQERLEDSRAMSLWQSNLANVGVCARDFECLGRSILAGDHGDSGEGFLIFMDLILKRAHTVLVPFLKQLGPAWLKAKWRLVQDGVENSYILRDDMFEVSKGSERKVQRNKVG